MSIKMKFTGLVLSLLLPSGAALASAGDFNKGLQAFAAGDFKTVLAEWVPLAQLGHVIAQNNLGVMYANGNGVLENDKAAVEWLTQAAEQGFAESQYELGGMYARGEGVPANAKTALKLLTLSAEQGHAPAQRSLGAMYELGQGVLENYQTAVKWYTLAAELGYAGAQSNLGFMYERGRGVFTDNRRAYMWYSIANYNGNELGGTNKDILAKQMTPADISKAQDMSSRCVESGYVDCS
jgi:TPR repeat protein